MATSTIKGMKQQENLAARAQQSSELLANVRATNSKLDTLIELLSASVAANKAAPVVPQPAKVVPIPVAPQPVVQPVAPKPEPPKPEPQLDPNLAAQIEAMKRIGLTDTQVRAALGLGKAAPRTPGATPDPNPVTGYAKWLCKHRTKLACNCQQVLGLDPDLRALYGRYGGYWSSVKKYYSRTGRVSAAQRECIRTPKAK